MEEPNLLSEEKLRILDRLDYLVHVLRELESLKGMVSETAWNNTRQIVIDIEGMVKEL